MSGHCVLIHSSLALPKVSQLRIIISSTSPPLLLLTDIEVLHEREDWKVQAEEGSVITSLVTMAAIWCIHLQLCCVSFLSLFCLRTSWYKYSSHSGRLLLRITLGRNWCVYVSVCLSDWLTDWLTCWLCVCVCVCVCVGAQSATAGIICRLFLWLAGGQ